MNTTPPKQSQNGCVPPPKPALDHEDKHITEPPQGYSRQLSSNPFDNALQNRSVMWAEPGLSDTGARSAGPEEPVIHESVDAGAVPGQAAAQLSSVPGTAHAHTGQTSPVQLAMSRAAAARRAVIAANNVSVKASVNETPVSLNNPSTQSNNVHETKPAEMATVHEAMRDAVDDALRLSRENAFAIVKTARQRLMLNEESRKFRKDTNPSQSTIADYQKKCNLIDKALEVYSPGNTNPLQQVMLQHAAAKQTFTAIKSALRWRALDRLREQLSLQDKLQRAPIEDRHWKRAVLEVQSTLGELQAIDALDRTECLMLADKTPKASRSKRKILPMLPDGWQKNFLDYNQNSPTYRHAGVVLRYCGVRPAELEQGVSLWMTDQGIRVLVPGAKVRSTAGQPARSFLLNPKLLPPWFVEELATSKRMVIRADKDAMRRHLYRLSEPVFNSDGRKRNKKLILSAYVFRHALVTDLRETGWTTEEIAAFIGESAAETANQYGIRVRVASKRPKPLVAVVTGSVRVPRAVKPIDLSGVKRRWRSKPNSSAS